MYSPETQQKVSDLRSKVAAGNYKLEDCKEMVRILREDRLSAEATGRKKGGKKAATPVDVDKLFSDLDKLP